MLNVVGTALKHKGFLANLGINLWFAKDQYDMEREEGKSVTSALVSSAADMAIPMMLGGWGTALYFGAQMLPGAVQAGVEAYQKESRTMAMESQNKAFQDMHFNDNEQIYTMRQAGMSIAQRSKYNVQQAMLGQEAKYMMK